MTLYTWTSGQLLACWRRRPMSMPTHMQHLHLFGDHSVQTYTNSHPSFVFAEFMNQNHGLGLIFNLPLKDLCSDLDFGEFE